MIVDPKFPPPVSLDDAIALLTIGGVECIKPAVQWLEANHPTHKHTILLAHQFLNRGGYLLEEALGVPDGTFGAGGTGKPPW